MYTQGKTSDHTNRRKENGYHLLSCIHVRKRITLRVRALRALFRAGERLDLFFVRNPLELPYRPFFGDAVDPVDAFIIALP